MKSAELLKLIVEPGADGQGGATFLLQDRDAILGRDPTCDLVVAGPTVSGRHALLRMGRAGWELTDLGSSNGSALTRQGGKPRPLAAGVPCAIQPGDILLLGGAEAPLRIRVEAARGAYAKPAPTDRTVLASAPLADLLKRAPSGLVQLAARSLAATDAQGLADAALKYLQTALPFAEAHAVLVTGAGFHAQAGEDPPAGLAREAASRHAVVVFEEAGEALPMTQSIARQGLRAAVVAPLVAHGSWHGLMAAWTTSPAAGQLPRETLEVLGVGASLVGLSAATLGVRLQGDAEREQLRVENRRLRGQKPQSGFVEPVGMSPCFQEAVRLCRTVAPASVPVLLLGETGTGKEVMARALHAWSPRKDAAFVAFNCAAVPDALLESELFGHVRGAFTGAGRDKQGLFEAADGGTVFLDEIGEMPTSMQAKLLRVLQDGEVRRVGANRTIRVDARVISATHQDLREKVANGSFRADLMYRLNAVTVTVPPLRDRRDDIPLLAHILLGRACRRNKKQIPGLNAEALAALVAHDWPGNVRELENELVRGVALTPAGHAIGPEVFSREITARMDPAQTNTARSGDSPRDAGGGEPAAATTPTLHEVVENAERRCVESTLGATGGNMSAAARALGLTRPGLYKVMERLGLRG